MNVFLTGAFLMIVLYTLFVEPVSVSLKKTASKITENRCLHSTSETKVSTEGFCKQETPFVTRLHQVNLKIF